MVKSRGGGRGREKLPDPVRVRGPVGLERYEDSSLCALLVVFSVLPCTGMAITGLLDTSLLGSRGAVGVLCLPSLRLFCEFIEPFEEDRLGGLGLRCFCKARSDRGLGDSAAGGITGIIPTLLAPALVLGNTFSVPVIGLGQLRIGGGEEPDARFAVWYVLS